MNLSDTLRVGAAGLRARPLRVLLSAAGIALGIAAGVAVVGISTSGRADLAAELDRLGTNLLTVTPGTTVFGDEAELPDAAPGMVGRIAGVRSVSATGHVGDVAAYRSDRIPDEQTNGLSVLAARPDLLATVGGQVHTGRWLDDATARYPAAVLGATAAARLGVGSPGQPVLLGRTWFMVIGVLDPVPLAEELDTAVLVGFRVAADRLGFDGHPGTVYERSADAAVAAVRVLLPSTADPEHPEQVRVSRPSDALAAREAADRALDALLLGLGGVALLVGGIGIANTMVISVLERRHEIGLRRALGATRGQVRTQFLTESLLLAALGGVAGAVAGVALTAAWSLVKGWPVAVPPAGIAAAAGVSLVVGAVAGLYPAARAARLDPTEALSA